MYSRVSLNRITSSIRSGSGGTSSFQAAYNAGPGNAAAWKELVPPDPDLMLEVIRFSETREYIKGIYEIFSIYKKIYDRSP